MFDIGQWREYLDHQPRLGIPSSWFTPGVFGEGQRSFETFTDEDYRHWGTSRRSIGEEGACPTFGRDDGAGMTW